MSSDQARGAVLKAMDERAQDGGTGILVSYKIAGETNKLGLFKAYSPHTGYFVILTDTGDVDLILRNEMRELKYVPRSAIFAALKAV